MKFKATDESNQTWEIEVPVKIQEIQDGMGAIIRRIPEKSELEKWINSKIPDRGTDYHLGLILGKWEGFRKAIEVIKEIHVRKTHEYPVTMYTLVDLIAELEAYCGDK